MKRNLVTFLIVSGIVGGLILLNQSQRDRPPAGQNKAATEVKKHLDEAGRADQQYAQNTKPSPTPSAAPPWGELPPPEEVAATLPELPAPENAQRYLFETTKGEWVLDVYPEWAPIGAAQFGEAVNAGVYDDAGIFRVMPGFVIQFGIPGDPELGREWQQRTIADEPVLKSNKRGTITFATSGPDSRTTQLFVSLGNNRNLDAMGFSPFGEVVHGMDIVDSINSEYREMPGQGRIQSMGNAYLRKSFRNLDYIKRVSLIADTTGQEL